MMDGSIVKFKGKYGIIRIKSKIINQYGYKSLNNVYLEDGSTRMCRDDELEVLNNDRTKEVEE
jgi:hypothetical protein